MMFAGKRLAILMYHRVLAAPDPFRDGDIDVDTFERHMRVLARYFNVIPLAKALSAGLDQLPPRAVCITFDDGYRDNYLQALPVLQRFNLPATIFVASGFLNAGRMWNDSVIETLRNAPAHLDLSSLGLGQVLLSDVPSRVKVCKAVLKALKHLPFAERDRCVAELMSHARHPLPDDLMLNVEQLKLLAASPLIEIGAHTVNHPILAKLDAVTAREEIVQSKQQLETWLQQSLRLFAYPNGRWQQDYNEQHVEMVRSAGFIAAVSTNPGVADANSPGYELPRFAPWPESSGRFALRLLLKLWGLQA